MTAEVAIANKQAVALAADSAVSIGPSADKIYTTALKIFQLAEGAPVGIMVSGAAEFLGIPWETIIKAYRNERGRAVQPKLKDYRDDFLEFISSHERLFSSQLQIRAAEQLIRTYFLYVQRLIGEELNRSVYQNIQLTENDIPDIIQDVVSIEQTRVSREDQLNGFDARAANEIRDALEPQIDQIKEDVFSVFPHSFSTSQKLTDLAVDMLTRNIDLRSRNVIPLLRSELVFAGFGVNDFLPRLYSIEVETMINNRIRWHETDRYEVNEEQNETVVVQPFAHTDMVDSFMRGIHPKIEDERLMTVASVLETFVNHIAEITEENDAQLGSNLRAGFTECVQSMLRATSDEWDSQTRDHYTPIVDNVSVLPKEELAAMAETLVNLTKFRLRVSPEREIVSGPIDVALISKGDGFVWLKRKHYFQTELNPRIISEYDRSD